MADTLSMGEMREIIKLDEGKYSFFVGRENYTLNTPLEEEEFRRVVSCVQELVASFPVNLSQDERLFLALISLSHKLDVLGCRVSLLAEKIDAGADKE